MDSTNAAGLKVWLVDDDPAILRVLSLWLGKAGYQVRQSSDGREALAAIETDCPDLLVTDWEMPHMSGLELCRAVRNLNLPHYVYILFLTAKSEPAEMIAGLEVGADEFLTKPVHQGELLARMRAGSRLLELERQLRLTARTDPLTGLMTRRTFYELLEREWQRAKRYHLPVSCVMLDIDFFKRINDTQGHPAGDAVLKTVAKLLTEACLGSDTVCRYGGEEFCAMLPETREDDAGRWAERIRQQLNALVISTGRADLRVTASFGAAQPSDDTQSAEGLVDRADQALLCAKQSGRDRVVCYESLNYSNEVDLRKSDAHEALFRGIEARHVMTPMVVGLREDETVGRAAEFFLRSRINSTPVVNAAGELAGMLSEKDLLAAMIVPNWWQARVGEVMKPNVISYEEDTPIRLIYEFLCRVTIRRVVIVKDNRPTGTISRGTLLRWFRNLVISRGLLASEDTAATADLDSYRSQQRLAETARELADVASRLENHVRNRVEDLVPYVVGSATGMQELVNDLLAYSRYANHSTGLAAVQSMLSEGSQVD